MSEPPNKLAGKVALITGGSRGIGLATAQRFVHEGAHVFLNARRQPDLDRAAARLGPAVTAVAGDVSNLADLDRLYDTVRATGRSLDILVTCAGFLELATLATATPEHFDRTFGVNARGTFFTVQKALPLLNDGASIVLVSSAGHLKGLPAYTAYSATKAAMRSFARSWAAELKGRRIRVNSLSPGPIDAPTIDPRVQSPVEASAMRAHFAALIPLGRMGTVEEMASAALFLASSDSSFSTGIDLVADGGFTQL